MKGWLRNRLSKKSKVGADAGEGSSSAGDAKDQTDDGNRSVVVTTTAESSMNPSSVDDNDDDISAASPVAISPTAAHDSENDKDTTCERAEHSKDGEVAPVTSDVKVDGDDCAAGIFGGFFHNATIYIGETVANGIDDIVDAVYLIRGNMGGEEEEEEAKEKEGEGDNEEEEEQRPTQSLAEQQPNVVVQDVVVEQSAPALVEQAA